jgi:hypothetical protein
MINALRLMIAKSPQASPAAINTMAAIRVQSPLVGLFYMRAVQGALHDPLSNFTEEERTLLASYLTEEEPPTSKQSVLQVRISDIEKEHIERLARSEQVSISEYIRRALNL